MSMCRVFTCVVGRGCLLWPVCSLDKTLIAFALLHSVLQDQICLLLQVSLNFLLLDSIALWQKGHLFWVLVLEGLVGLMSEWVSEVAQSCLTVCDRRDCSLPEFSVHGILQARILEWFTISFSRGSSWPRDWTWVSCGSCIANRFLPLSYWESPE